jgi:hypothetical protein
MTAGLWFVLCDRSRAISMSEVAERLPKVTYYTVARDGEALIITVLPPQSSEPAEITIGLSTADHVQHESQEIADEHAADRPDYAKIAAADARYEMVWEPHQTDDVFEIVDDAARRIAEATGGVIYDTAALLFL